MQKRDKERVKGVLYCEAGESGFLRKGGSTGLHVITSQKTVFIHFLVSLYWKCNIDSFLFRLTTSTAYVVYNGGMMSGRYIENSMEGYGLSLI